jgi:transmembrane sensor
MLGRNANYGSGDDAMLDAWHEMDMVRDSAHYSALLGTPTWRERLVAANEGIASSPWRFALPVLPLAVTAVGLALFMTAPHMDHYSAQGHSQQIVLGDQSTVVLAPSSTVDFHMADGKRLATLVGKAEFSIAHDKEHPFLIAVGAARVRVVGTHFILTHRNACTQLSVLSGTVMMQSPTMVPRRLDAGEEAVSIDEGQSPAGCQTPGETTNALRWSYVDTPLSTVVEDIGRFYPTRIDIPSPELGRKRVTMSFGIDEVHNIVNILPESVNAHLERRPGLVKIVPN